MLSGGRHFHEGAGAGGARIPVVERAVKKPLLLPLLTTTRKMRPNKEASRQDSIKIERITWRVEEENLYKDNKIEDKHRKNEIKDRKKYRSKKKSSIRR